MRTQDGSRWVAVGTSASSDAREAGLEAARAAIDGPEPGVLIAFASDDLDLDAFAAALVEVAGDVPVVGCSTAGEIGPGGVTDGAAVVVGIGGPGFSVRTALARDASADLRRAGAEVTAAAHPDEREHQAVVLLSDGLAGDQQEVVRGAYSAAGALIPLVGGCAGDEMRMQRTRQIYGREVLTDAVIAIGLASDAPIGVAAEHGWRRVGEAMLVTAAEANCVLELDGRPALDVYVERLGVPADLADDPTAFASFALTHPLGLARRDGEEVRFIAGGDVGDRSLRCIAEVPVGGLVHLMEGDAVSVLGATDAACADAVAALDGHDPLGLVVFDCVARRAVLTGDGLEREVRSIESHANGAPLAGFYTYGEFGRRVGIRGFHNQTLVVLALA
ncbi:MAG: FIST signal transduction protein [Acidimicrobiia bacterium]